jgi:RNA polymerase sigma factor (sigma-70 family)
VHGHQVSPARMLNVTRRPRVDVSSRARFDVLFDQFYPEVFGLVYRVLGNRMETEDTLQDTFLKLSEESELQTRPGGEIGAWLRRVGLNLAFNRLRSAKRSRDRLERVGRLERSDEEAVDNELASPAELVVREEERLAVQRALVDVPERQRQCLLLRHSGYSYAEIAATLGIAIGSVGVLLARAEKAFTIAYRRQSFP